jgi:type III pantothenate kinase
MLLAVDIGNTNTVAGVFRGDDLIAQWRIATDRQRMADEYAAQACTLFQLAGLDPTHIAGAIIAGVVPGAQRAICEAITSYLHITPALVSAGLDAGIPVKAHGAGADRIANAAAAVERYGAPAIVVDFGTSINFDVIDRSGAYVGGALAPGLEISMAALSAGTAQLPQVPLEAPPAAIGDRTLTALQSGIIFGFAGLVDGLVRRIDAELGGGAQVIATGGLASVVAPHAETVRHIDDDLTLRGLRLIYERNAHNSAD